MSVNLLVFCSVSQGGLADYAHAQATALAAQNYSVLLLAPSGFSRLSTSYQYRSLPSNPSLQHLPRWCQRLTTALTILRQQVALNRAIHTTGVRHVLLTSYSEYLAPFWAWRLRCWRRTGLCFAAVVHDPVRDFVVGPSWWHRFSIAQGYSFLDVAFLHAPIQLDTGTPQPQLQTQLIPHGPFGYPCPQSSSSEIRRNLDVPPNLTLLLSFGHIRNNKNLHLILKAITKLPQICLLVSGPDATAGHRPASYYRQLAEHLGVASRCRWQIGYQTPEQVADHFTSADAVLLSYSSEFRSASGVMHLAAHYRKPVIASAGDSPLLDAVCTFGLGVVVRPDSSESLVQGISHFLDDPPLPDWLGYERDNSWERNAELVAQAMGLESQEQTIST